MKLRVKEIAEALGSEPSDIIAICTILKIPANSRISLLTIEDAKKVTDYFEINEVK